MSPVPVLFITRKWAPAIGGMETYCVRLVEELRRAMPVEVIALPGRADGRVPTALSLVLFPFIVLRRWSALRDVPEIVHLGDLAIWPLALLHWLLAPRAGIVVSAHGTDISYARRKTLRGRAYRLYQRAGANLLQRARIIANSQATAAACREMGWRKVTVCPLATDMKLQVGVEPRPDTLLFAGRLIRQKGLSWFVAEVLDHLPEEVTLHVAGMPVEACESAALEHPRVRHLGPLAQDCLAREYALAGCVIVPNVDAGDGSFEGFGLVACEAAAAGGVVLAADLGGLSAAVRHGETGFLLPPGDAARWVDQIRQVLDWNASERTRFTSKGAAVARRHFSWERVAERVVQQYHAFPAKPELA